MPYELETDKRHKFFNATQIAILLSLGLHVSIYKYGFPISLFKEKSSNQDRMVSTIELSPLEQARLPNLDSQWSVPQFDNTPLDEAAPPFALPLPPNFTPSTDLPAVSIPPGYSFPNIPPISSDIELPPLGITDLSALPLPPPLTDLDSIVPPDSLTTPEEPTEEKPTEESLNPPPETPPEPEKPESNKPTPEQIAAVREQKLKGNLRVVSKTIQKKDGETSDEEARKNYVAWLSKIENVEPELVEIEGIYPKDACIRKLEGQSIYGVVVNANNEVVALDLIKSAEYGIFNEKASEDIQTHDFANQTNQINETNETNETNEIKEARPYQVTVDYKYDPEICPSLTLPSLKKQEETAPKPKTETAPKPESQPQPKPEAETKPQPKPESQPQPKPEAETETLPKPESQPQPETESKPQPKPESQPQPEAETETKPESQPLPSLRERLQNTPLPDDNTIRERLRRNPLPKQ